MIGFNSLIRSSDIGFNQSPRTFGNFALPFGHLAALFGLPLIKMPFSHFSQTLVFFFITPDRRHHEHHDDWRDGQFVCLHTTSNG